MPQYRVTKTLTYTFTAAILVEADDEDAAIAAAGENEALMSEPRYTLPADDSNLDEQWSDDIDFDLEADEVEPDVEVKQGDPCANCGKPIEDLDHVADGHPMCIDCYERWCNLTA